MKMTATNIHPSDKVFAGSIPELYEAYLVPLIFEPYAADLAARLASRPLEPRARNRRRHRRRDPRAGIGAAGDSVAIVATDLNQPMLDHARRARARAPGRVAPGRRAAAAVRRRSVRRGRLPVRRDVLPRQGASLCRSAARARPGGVFIFNVWDRIEENEFADAVTTALAAVVPAMIRRASWRARRTATTIRPPSGSDLRRGGFDRAPDIETVPARSRAQSRDIPAIAYCQGTPLRNEIEARDASRLAEATDGRGRSDRASGSDAARWTARSRRMLLPFQDKEPRLKISPPVSGGYTVVWKENRDEQEVGAS